MCFVGTWWYELAHKNILAAFFTFRAQINLVYIILTELKPSRHKIKYKTLYFS